MSRIIILLLFVLSTQTGICQTNSFNTNWKFNLGNTANAEKTDFDDVAWRVLELPHDWSIELPFDKESPTGTSGGALRGGIGWYRKTFSLPITNSSQFVAIRFDGVYCNSEVWINDHYLGKRPNGYTSFQYELTPYLKFGKATNTLVVKVDNSQQPNSRWYSGSGIYRNVWLTVSGKAHVQYNGTYFTTPEVSAAKALVNGEVIIENTSDQTKNITVETALQDASGKTVTISSSKEKLNAGESKTVISRFTLLNPVRWSVERPYLYKAVTTIRENGKQVDRYITPIGIRSFKFDAGTGFSINEKRIKIRGVCNHHDLGCLGTAVNRSALKRQLTILKAMGCNGIRTSHNPPAPELLELCDEMGFIVMDETFDMWKRSKSTYDYHLAWDEWHRRDLEDHIKRDRNHPSVFSWSLGNEIGEQWAKDEDTAARNIIHELAGIVKSLDTRPTVTANNEINPWNRLLQANATELIGYNYNHTKWDSVAPLWGAKPFIVTESVSALQTRGHYDMPSDSVRRWPVRWDLPLLDGNADTTCSAYDNCAAPWGSTHEATLKVMEKYDHISGMYIWTGFDYIGEPTPYAWPARSSYFGIIDLAGFPKDVYYLYQSIWTSTPVLHIFPHWNWKDNQLIDIWAYYNNADEVELFINGISAGIRKKQGDDMHVVWRVNYKAGYIKAVSRKNGKIVLSKDIKTAGASAKILLQVDKKTISAKNKDLGFIKVTVLDKQGNIVPDASNLIQFTVKGGSIAGVDNGSQTSMESFKANKRKAFNGLCLAMIKPADKSKLVTVTASSTGLLPATISFAVD